MADSVNALSLPVGFDLYAGLFIKKFLIGDECWEWTASKDRLGYGRFGSYTRGSTLAHRVSYKLFVGPIPEGMELDHLCGNRGCVRPDHLEPVTHAENMRRGIQGSGPSCPNGHPYLPNNLYTYKNGKRMCRICATARRHRYEAKTR